MSAQNEKCEHCGKSTAGDTGADAGPGTLNLCYTCRTDKPMPKGVFHDRRGE